MIAWCWSNERAQHFRPSGALCGGRALSVDGAVLSGAVRLRAEDRAVADCDCAAALHAGVRPDGRAGSHQGRARAILAGQFQAADLGQSVHPVVSAQPGRGAGLDRDPAFDRLPDRLRHGAAAAALASHRDDAGNRAVLDLVPDPHLCLDQHFAARRPAQQGAAGVAYHLSAAGVALDRQRDVSRHRLFLFAVHDPAALCDAGENGPGAARGRCRSRRLAAAGILAGDGSAVAAGRRSRGAALLHPDRRRVRDSRSVGRIGFPDDRPDPVAGIFHQQGLAGGIRRCDRAAGSPGRAAVAVRAIAAPPARGGKLMAGKVNRITPFNVTALALGLAFLYLPIVILVIYSFNASRLVTVWGGWSLRWYHEFFNDGAMLDAAWMSLRVAAMSATAATILGTLAAVALTRGERFRGRTLFSGMLYAPLVMPEVISGLSLLLLFVALDAGRGFWTVTIAHTTLTMCFVTVVVQSRLGAIDRSLEEAAMDLGCDPVRAFLSVTLPLIIPSIAAGWMLAFTLSLDDVVIASFTTGPGSATLPIRIYSEVRLGVKPEINAICTMVIALIAVVIVVASFASRLSSAQGESAAPL